MPISVTETNEHIDRSFQSLFLITYQKVIYPCGYIQCMHVCQLVNIMTNNSTVLTVNIRKILYNILHFTAHIVIQILRI